MLTICKWVLKLRQGDKGGEKMADVNVFDVAEYILNKRGRLTTWKLQKLCYYSQAWSLAWDSKPLFNERIEAWVNGPVIPNLYDKHRGNFYATSVGGNPKNLNKTQRDTINAVLKTYGDKPSSWLSACTHRESPWKDARRRARLAIGERGNSQIRLDDMAEYYEGLSAERTA
jgi:uncharacterized phage-associated protein